MNDTTRDEPKLAPCPFCGGQLTRSSAWLVHPENSCALTGFEFASHEADAWNRRAACSSLPDGPVAEETPAEDALRSLACWLGVGGYNAPTVDAKVFEQKIRDGLACYSQRHGFAARDLAELVLSMGMATEKGIRARDLARQVLGIVPFTDTTKALRLLTDYEVQCCKFPTEALTVRAIQLTFCEANGLPLPQRPACLPKWSEERKLDFARELGTKIAALPLTQADCERVNSLVMWGMAQMFSRGNCGPYKAEVEEPKALTASPSAQPPEHYAMLQMLQECKEYLRADPSTVGGRPEAERLIKRIEETMKGQQ